MRKRLLLSAHRFHLASVCISSANFYSHAVLDHFREPLAMTDGLKNADISKPAHQIAAA